MLSTFYSIYLSFLCLRMMWSSDMVLLQNLRFQIATDILSLQKFCCLFVSCFFSSSKCFLNFPQRNIVAYDEGQTRKLEKALELADAISDLPPVCSNFMIFHVILFGLFSFLWMAQTCVHSRSQAWKLVKRWHIMNLQLLSFKSISGQQNVVSSYFIQLRVAMGFSWHVRYTFRA